MSARKTKTAAILAEGADFGLVMEWITAHAGEPEARVTAGRGGGLHGARLSARGGAAAAETPLRFVLPAGALAAQAS